MSWFKRGERKSPSSERERSDTDPNTCLEVFQNHWKQVCVVLNGSDKRLTSPGCLATVDGVEAVLSNLEQMITLLVGEDDEGGLPGPILQYLMETELLESFCSWCTVNVSTHERLRLQQLRIFEHIISQSKQLLLVHRPVIKPLLRVLIDVSESQELTNNGELEFKLVLVLHQICICISQQNLILESFFSTDADHGPARFLIFSLLIPYIHREGPVGQKARDALLLIMTLSARHPHIGQYIANNSHFCPVLATGLSGLYSSLPHRLTPSSDDWYAITYEDCQRIPDLQMFLNSLEFSNAVVQIAHPLVRDQLIEYIYTGFLVPVLAPALHQDIPGLPIPLLDTEMFRISREEVMTATAYLDLFIRHVTDPSLLRAVLKFVMTHKYLVPCTHVMVSQRRSVRDLDIYGKSAEKFLSLRPICCASSDLSSSSAADSASQLSVRTSSDETQTNSLTPSKQAPGSLSNLSGSTGLPELVEQAAGESSYLEYLYDARQALAQKKHACSNWSYLYDGESPLPDSVKRYDPVFSQEPGRSRSDGKENIEDKEKADGHPPTGYIELGSMLKSTNESREGPDGLEALEKSSEIKAETEGTDIEDSVFLSAKNREEDSQIKCNKGKGGRAENEDTLKQAKLYASLESVDTFLAFLLDWNSPTPAVDLVDSGKSVLEAATLLEDVLRELEKFAAPRNSVRFSINDSNVSEEKEDECVESSIDVSSLSPIGSKSISSSLNPSEIPINDLSSLSAVPVSASKAAAVTDATAWENLTTSDLPAEPQVKIYNTHHIDGENTSKRKGQDSSSFVNISIVPEEEDKRDGDKQQDALQKSVSPSALSSSHSPSTPPPNPSSALPVSRKSCSKPNDFPEGFKQTRFLASTPLLSSKQGGDHKPTVTPVTPAEEFPPSVPSCPLPKKQLRFLNDPPNIGPFLSSLLLRLEGMAGNSLYFNLLLTGVISRLAAYPQPLLRSFLLNHNLVFQPSVKSLVQVLSSLRQKLDSYSVTVKQFDQLVARARYNLAQRELSLYSHSKGVVLPESLSTPSTLSDPLVIGDGLTQNHQQQANSSKNLSHLQPIKEKRKASLADIFRRSPGREKMPTGKQKRSMSLLQRIQVCTFK
ncbi:FTS and Hook-interacting protein homolog [Elysia marginata]|uniref:FTS and Hook-interacting protein homolog n=1 Tax=Elysia marginata TaxID=1093978 RepID=A0AAV4FAX8_9GAST|nr:FTS and Hook-interacting protein homolog [Elysia marginata]